MSAAAPDPGVSVLRVLGDGDAWTRLRLRSDLRAALDAGNARSPLIVDLTAATALDGAAAALLVESIARCEAEERPCVLLLPESCPEPVRGRFERGGLNALLPIARSWDEALRRAGARQGQVDEPGWTSPVS